MRHVAIALLSAHFPNKNQREDSAKRKMISVSRLANRGTEMMKRYCTAAGDSTLVLEKIVQIFLLRFRRSKKLVRKSFKGRFESYSNDCLLFFLSSLLNEDAVRNLQLDNGPRRTKIVSISASRTKKKLVIHSRNRWQNFVVQS